MNHNNLIKNNNQETIDLINSESSEEMKAADERQKAFFMDAHVIADMVSGLKDRDFDGLVSVLRLMYPLLIDFKNRHITQVEMYEEISDELNNCIREHDKYLESDCFVYVLSFDNALSRLVKAFDNELFCNCFTFTI